MMLAKNLYDAILRHGEAMWPQECCGFLVGNAQAIDEVIAVTNAAEKMKAERPEEFTRTAEMGYVMDPQEQMKVMREADRSGRLVRGIYHSHVEVGAYFSDEDKRRALFDGEPMFPDAIYVVADIRQKKAAGARAFAWDESTRDFVEVPLEVG